MKFLRFFRRRQEDERGAVLILTAASMVLLLGAGAMGVDLGFSVYGSRTAQAMADTAALDLTQDIPVMDNEASNAAITTDISNWLAGVDTDNGSNAYLYGVPGVYQNGEFSTYSAGCANTVFQTTPPPCNAIEVWATQKVPQIFWGGFNSLTAAGSTHAGSGTCTGSCTPPPGTGCSSGSPSCSPPPGSCTGTTCNTPTPCNGTCAAWQPEVGFDIGSYLVSINTQQSAVLNVLLGTLGGSANVTAVGYQGMANTYVSFNDLITASGGLLTTSNVMTANLTGDQWLGILNTADANQVALLSCGSSPTPLPCEASTGLSALHSNATTSAKLCQMISIDGTTCTNNTLSSTALKGRINVLQLLTTEAELANGSNAIDVTSALGLPSVTSAKLSLNLIQPPQPALPGPVGSATDAAPPCPQPSPHTSTCAVTAQVSSDLNLTVLQALGGPITVDIPLSAAVGYATLFQVTCSTTMAFQRAAINIATTTASGTVTVGNTAIGTLTLSGVSPEVGKTFRTIPPTAASASSSINPNPVNVSVNGNNVSNEPPTPTLTYSGSLSGLDANVVTLLSANLGPVLGPVLQVTGASVGGAQVAATYEKCDAIQTLS